MFFERNFEESDRGDIGQIFPSEAPEAIKEQEASPCRLEIGSRGHSGSDKESSDEYAGVVAVLNPHWRVIVCKDRLQYILQMRRGKDQWRGASYCVSRKALERCIRERNVGEISTEAFITIRELGNL